jgi:hypothetical protein
MSNYDPYDQPPVREHSRRYVREERRDDRDPRYVDSRDSYLKVYPSRDLVPRGREDSDLSVEEVRREFPPPSYNRGIGRAHSAGHYDDDYDRYARGNDGDYDDDYRRRSKKGPGSHYYEEEKSRKRILSKQEKIIAAVAGAALALGGKEIYDRREAKEEHTDIKRNPLASAALGAAGALAGYQGADFYNKHAAKEEKKSSYILHRGHDGKITEYYSDEDEDPKEKKGGKSFLEGALAAAGLGGAVKALTGGSGRDDKRDGRSRRGSSDSDRSRSGGKNENVNRIQKAAMASLIAGATEAFRVSKEPGSWKGEKTKRILTAAAGAGAIDSAQNPEKSGKLGILESVIGGLVGNRVINGSKSNIEEDRKTGRSRSRSRAGRSRSGGPSGLAALATAGLGAIAGKKIVDGVRERSQSRSGRKRSVDSYDSRNGSPDRRHRSRSRSVVDTARKSLAKLGIGKGPEDRDRDRRRDYSDDDDYSRSSHRPRRYSDDEYDGDRSRDDPGRSRRGEYDEDASHDRRRGGSRRGSEAGSESDLGDSDEDKKRARRMRGKQILTTGLAAVATIHAAHEVYQSVEKRQARKKAVKEGRLSPEEAKKLKTKALLQDAASVGIAALGIKGAISELKEAKELSHECKEFQEEKARRHARRLERLKQANSGSDGRRRDDNWSSPNSPRSDRYDYGTRYLDGNPYSAALPAPPVGYDGR